MDEKAGKRWVLVALVQGEGESWEGSAVQERNLPRKHTLTLLSCWIPPVGLSEHLTSPWSIFGPLRGDQRQSPLSISCPVSISHPLPGTWEGSTLLCVQFWPQRVLMPFRRSLFFQKNPLCPAFPLRPPFPSITPPLGAASWGAQLRAGASSGAIPGAFLPCILLPARTGAFFPQMGNSSQFGGSFLCLPLSSCQSTAETSPFFPAEGMGDLGYTSRGLWGGCDYFGSLLFLPPKLQL